MCQAHEKGVSSTKPEEIAVAVTVDGKPDKEAPRGSLRGLYRYADLTDAMLLLVGTLAVIAGATNQPLQLIVFGRLMDSFNLSNKDEVRDRVHLMAGLYACLGVMQVVTNSIHVTCYSKVAARQARRIRLAYFRALARKPMSFFDAPGQDAGALASSVMDKALTVQIGLGDDLAKLLLQTVQFATSLTTALYFVWPLALVSLGAVPCLSVVVGFANAAYARATRNSAAVLDMATSTPLEAVGAIRTVNAYCRERPILSLYSEMCSSARAQGMALGRARAMLEGTVAPIMFVMFGGCLWFGSSLVSNDMQKHDYCNFINPTTGELQDPDPQRCTTGGNVMTSFLCILFGFMGFLQALPSISAIAAAKASGADIFAAIDAAPGAIDSLGETGEKPSSCSGRLELKDVTFAYPARKEVRVYDGLSLTIDAGQVVALAGPSGCGKSTLVALLERWYDVDAGTLCLDGADVRSLSVQWLRSQIGLVSQEPVLFSGSIGWNIGLGAGEGVCTGDNDASVVQAARLANADGFVSAMPEGYSTQVGEKGIQLSGGQKQRIAIARALVRQPAVLVLDEATSALDMESERVVQAALDEIMTKQRRTTIIIAHRLSTIRNADKIAVVSGGRVVEEGPHEELVDKEGGIYKALVAHSAGGALK